MLDIIIKYIKKEVKNKKIMTEFKRVETFSKNIYLILRNLFVYLFFVVGFLAFTNVANAATYCVDATGGLDTNTGTSVNGTCSDSSPWQTIAKVNTFSFSSGDYILFKRGEVWREQLTKTETGINIGVFGVGNKPLIDSSDEILGASWSKTAGKTNVYQTAITIPSTGGYVRIWENDTLLTRVASIDLVDATPSSYYPSSESAGAATMYIHATASANPATNGKTYEYSARDWGVSVGASSTITNIETRRNYHNNGSMIAAADCILTDIEANDGSKHNILIEEGCTINGGIFNEAFYGTNQFIPLVIYSVAPTGKSVSLVDVEVSMSQYQTKCTGIYGHTGGTGAFGNISINGAVVTNCKSGYGGTLTATSETINNFTNTAQDGADLSVGITVVSPAIITNSSVYGRYRAILLSSTATSLLAQANVIFGYAHGISDSTGQDIEIRYNSFTGGASTYGVYAQFGGSIIAYNNTFYGISRGISITASNEPTLIVKNNIFHTVTTSVANSTPTEVSNNCYYNSSNRGGTGSITTDPLFVSTSDFHLQSTSPAINAGTDVSLTSDISGNPIAGLPDMGAYEYQPAPFAPTIGAPSAQSVSSIRWNFTDNASDETGFRIYDNTNTLATSSATTNLTYLDETGLSSNTAYSGRYAKAYNSFGESVSSSVASTIYTKIESPVGASWDSIGINAITLSASGTLSNLASGTSGLYFANTTASTNSGWTQTNSWQSGSLSENTQYTFQATSRNGDSLANTAVDLGSKYTLADVPTNFSASSNSNSVSLSVDSFPNDTSGSSGYYFSRSGANSGWIQTNSWTDTGLSCGNEYTYSVKYRNGDGTETSLISITKSTNGCPSSGSTAQSRIRNLLSMGNNTQAQQVANQYNVVIPPGAISSTVAIPNISNSYTTLRNGASGMAVVDLQRFLNIKLNLNLAVDGKFGPKTKSAVILFQTVNDLIPDGIVGPKTKVRMSAI